jgi:hypothetical protein
MLFAMHKRDDVKASHPGIANKDLLYRLADM